MGGGGGRRGAQARARFGHRAALSGCGLVAVIAAAVIAAAVPAAAVDGGAVTIKAAGGEKVSRQFGPMPASDTSEEFATDPETCAELPWCTVFRVTFTYPEGHDPDIDEFVLPWTVSWDDTPIVQGTAQDNDLNVYVYTREETKDSAGQTVATYRQIDSAATAMEPENSHVLGPHPANPTVYFVVYNYLGVNVSGFEFDAFVRSVRVEEVGDYDLAPARTPPGETSGEPDAPGRARPGTRGRAPLGDGRPSTPSALPMAVPMLSPVGAGGPEDPTLAFGGGDDDFQSELDGGRAGADLLAAARRALGPSAPVSGAALAFWLGFVPLALFGAAGAALYRRRPGSLILTVPAAA